MDAPGVNLRAQTATGAAGASMDKVDAQVSLEDGKRIQNFEEAFSRIKSATGIEDIEELVRLLHHETNEQANKQTNTKVG